MTEDEAAFCMTVKQAVPARFLKRYDLTDELLLEAATETAGLIGGVGEWDGSVAAITTGEGESTVGDSFINLFPPGDRPYAARLFGVIVRWHAPPELQHRLDLVVAGV